MNEEGLIALLVLAGVVFVIYVMAKTSGSFRKGYEEQWDKYHAEDIKKGKKPYGAPWGHAYGSAYFMLPQQLLTKGLGISLAELRSRRLKLDAGFIFFGELSLKSYKEEACPILDGPGHALTIAPTRSGKGTCAVVPNLLTYSGSVIVNDIKGENYAVTATWRDATAQPIYKVAPFDDDTARWNPFDTLQSSDEAWDDARHMAELLIPDSYGKDEFWNNGARNLLAGLILHIHYSAEEKDRNLARLRDLLTQDEEEFNETIAEMLNSGEKLVARAANVFSRADTKVRSGILSTLDSELSFLDSPRLAECTRESDFHFRDLKRDTISIYLIIPPERLRTYAPFVRLFMGMAALELKREKAKPEFPVLFMLDEFPALGRMKVIEEEMSFLAGYDIRLWLFAQDLKQLAAIYGEKAQSIISNCKVKQFFGISDYETAKFASLMCGETTVPQITVSSASGISVDSSTETRGDRARSLMDPNEIMNMPANFQLVFIQGQQPVMALKINYLEAHLLFTNREDVPYYDPNPYHQAG